MGGGYDPGVAVDQRVIGHEGAVEDSDVLAFDAEAAAGRRRRGLIIVAVIAAVGIPLTSLD
jgi:hypothetical protein